MRRPATVLALLLAALTACTSVGPDRVRTDQVEYGDAIGDAARRQTLLNIVKLRHGDVPSLLTVGQVTTNYGVSGSASVGAAVLPGQSFSLGEDGTVGLGGTVSASPSVVYRPLTGQALSQALFTPLEPAALVGLVAAGPGDGAVLGLALKSVDGWSNALAGDGGIEPADPEFDSAVALLSRLIQRGEVTLGRRGDAPPPVPAEPVITAVPIDPPADAPVPRAAPAAGPAVPGGAGLALRVTAAARDAPDMRRLRDLLGVGQDAMELPLVDGVGHERDGALRLRTRSLMEVLNAAAAGVEAGGTAAAGPPAAAPPGRPALTVRRSATPPMGSFAAVRYAGDWYYVEAADPVSRRALAVVMLLADVAQPAPGR